MEHYLVRLKKEMTMKSNKAPKPKFKMQKTTGLERKVAKKVKEARKPQAPNATMDFKGGVPC